MQSFELHHGHLPLLVSLPHNGTQIPEDIRVLLVDEAQSAPDTDWYVDRLYDFALALGASVLKPRYSRYVVDLNRPPDDAALYPGQNSTGLCPTAAFSGRALYREGKAPNAEAVQQRRLQYWQPYHTALQAELQRIQQLHGRVLLWEGHSIRPELPFLFAGRLPDFNLGTAGGHSFPDAHLHAVEAVLAAQSAYTWISNGRFKGGYITRHYAAVGAGIYAFQLELAQTTYMDATLTAFDAVKAAPVQRLIEKMLYAALAAIT